MVSPALLRLRARSAIPELTRKSAAYVGKNYRYLVKDPSFFLMKTAARFEFARDWMTRPRRDVPLLVEVASSAISAQHSIAATVATLRSEGYYVGMSLAPDLREELVSTARASFCYANRDPQHKFRIDELPALEQRLDRSLRMASYFDQQEDWPAFRRLKTDPWLHAVAREYLGCTPLYIRSEVAWTFPYAATEYEKLVTAQVFHCDINDWKSLKFFFYLNDVGPQNGPHVYLKKNGRPRTLLHQALGQRCASLRDELLVETYGAEHIVTVCGPAGFGFVGDPYYFHRGTPPEQGARLLLQMEFARKRYRTWYFEPPEVEQPAGVL